MISYVRKLPFWRNYTTSQWSRWWRDRDIDWKEDYLSTWNHPHRNMLMAVLQTFDWFSLLEIGCGAGANMYKILQTFKAEKQLGGIDISPEAIEVAKKAFQGAFLKVGSVEDIMMSDNSADVILSDMCLIYIGPSKIKKVLSEVKRIARGRIVLCEFHAPKLKDRLMLRARAGIHAYDYVKLLESQGFHDVTLYKMPKECWPGADDQKNKFRYVIVAKVPKRK
jgi:ubiquinone/menaquinone biosynthesis C-methylase UbiE